MLSPTTPYTLTVLFKLHKTVKGSVTAGQNVWDCLLSRGRSGLTHKTESDTFTGPYPNRKVRLVNNQTATFPTLLTPTEAASLLRIGKGQLFAMMAAGHIPCTLLGPRTYRIKESDLLKMFEA